MESYVCDLPVGQEFSEIVVCYCAYKPLAVEDAWTKKAHRLAPSLDSFGGDEEAYQQWLDSQKEAAEV